MFLLVEQEAGARHVGGSSFNGESGEHAEHTVRVVAWREEEEQGGLHKVTSSLFGVAGPAWKAEECCEEGQKHLGGT